MQQPQSHQPNSTDEEERSVSQYDNTRLVYHGITDRVMGETSSRDAATNRIPRLVISSGNTTASFQLLPRGNQRPGAGSLNSSNRGRKRRSGSGLASGGLPVPSPAEAPLSVVSLGPASDLIKKSVVSPSDTPNTAGSSAAKETGGDQKRDITHRNYSEGVQRYLLESPGVVLGGALSSLALQSPRPSPCFAPRTQNFSHQVKSSPFSFSSSRGAALSQHPSLLSPTGMSALEDSVTATPSSSFGLQHQRNYASSVHQETPPTKTAPLTLITHTPVDRKRSPASAGSFLPYAPKSPRTEERNSEPGKGLFDRKISAPYLISTPDMICSPNVLPLSTFALNPLSNSGSMSFFSFGPSPPETLSHPRQRMQTTTSEALPATSRSGSVHHAVAARAWPSTSTERMMMRPPETPRSTKKTSAPVGENSTHVAKSDVSFIPLPDWDESVESSVRTSQHQEPSLPPRPLRAFSLLHSTDRSDPIDQIIMMSSFQGNQGGIHQTESSDESFFLDNESLSDDQDDNDFLLVAPGEIEEERKQQSKISSSISSVSELYESRPNKHPRHGSRPSNNDNHEEKEKSSYGHHDEVKMPEWTDHLCPLLQMKPSPVSSCRADSRDLVTPPAMPNSGSPPPLVMRMPEFH